MDDSRISQLREEVLAALRAPVEAGSLESRVAALERAVARLEHAPGTPASTAATPAPASHPSLRVLEVACGGERCLLEPDKPCTNTGTCRSLGH